MSHERIRRMKDNLICCLESQINNIQEADAEELGEAVDMLKDLEEALYYATITEAMQGKEKSKHMESETMYARPYYPMYDRGTSSMIPSDMSRDPREGRSPESRKMYLEAKHSGVDKSMQLKELEKYMQELTNDMVDLIQDASPEEKQYLEKKISGLATKIGSMK